MDVNDFTKQVTQNLKENISLRKEIKEGFSSWKRKLFGSKKEESTDDVQAQQQNQQESQNANQIGDFPSHINVNNLTKQQLESIEKMNEVLQQSISNKINVSFKTIQKWYLVMMNEPSIGMYYIQDHNKNVVENIVEDKKEIQKMNRKLQYTTEQLNNTKKELKDIAKLNGEWSNNIAQYIDRLGKAL